MVAFVPRRRTCGLRSQPTQSVGDTSSGQPPAHVNLASTWVLWRLAPAGWLHVNVSCPRHCQRRRTGCVLAVSGPLSPPPRELLVSPAHSHQVGPRWAGVTSSRRSLGAAHQHLELHSMSQGWAQAGLLVLTLRATGVTSTSPRSCNPSRLLRRPPHHFPKDYRAPRCQSHSAPPHPAQVCTRRVTQVPGR